MIPSPPCFSDALFCFVWVEGLLRLTPILQSPSRAWALGVTFLDAIIPEGLTGGQPICDGAPHFGAKNLVCLRTEVPVCGGNELKKTNN